MAIDELRKAAIPSTVIIIGRDDKAQARRLDTRNLLLVLELAEAVLVIDSILGSIYH